MELTDPPNAESTIRSKGRDAPLKGALADGRIVDSAGAKLRDRRD